MKEEAGRWAGVRPDTLERRLRTAVEQSPLVMHVFTPEGRSLLANAAWDRLWNLLPGESPEDKNIFKDEQVRASGLLPYVREALGGEAVTTPSLLYDPGRAGREGSPVWLRAFVYPVRGEGGGDVGVMNDVTERKPWSNGWRTRRSTIP